jgi:hypothetical protein
MNRSFACDTNTGTDLLTVSLALATPEPNVVRIEYLVDLATASTGLPAWWDLAATTGCRSGALRTDAVIAADAVACADWAEGQALAALTTAGSVSTPNTLRLRGQVVVPTPVPLAAGQEWFVAHVGFSHARTVGTGACDGCTTPACVVLKRVSLFDPTFSNIHAVRTVFPGAQGAVTTWQGGAGVVRTNVAGFTDCPAATSVQRSRWGALKSLYR